MISVSIRKGGRQVQAVVRYPLKIPKERNKTFLKKVLDNLPLR